MSEWISAKDQLPTEEDGEVAVRLSDGSKMIAWASSWYGASNDFTHWTFPIDMDDVEVTHWCKLPELEV